MPILQHLRMPLPKTHQSESEIEDLLDFWENQFPNIVLSCNTIKSIITQPNIAKSMSMEEKIWEISCEGIELSAIQEDDPEENKTDATYNILELDRIEGAGYYTNISDVRDDNSLSDIIARARAQVNLSYHKWLSHE